MTVTVVICTRARPALLEKCLLSVQRLSPSPDVTVVVDNTGGDPETKRIAELFQARYLVEPKIGLNHARKRALKERETDMMAFLTDDVIPSNDWLASLLPGIAADEAEDAVNIENDARGNPAIQ